MDKLNDYREQLREKNTEETILWAINEFGIDRIVLASSFSIEDQVLTRIMAEADDSARIFTLDTGRHFQKTYDVMQRTMEKYGFRYEVCSPAAEEITAMVSEDGPNLFFKSVELRKKCCEIRKVRPLRKILSTVDAWICGLRRDQSVTRTALEKIEWDETFGIYKINPLYDWSESMVLSYIRENDVPCNALYDDGYRSIGCEPCTRPVGKDDDIRSGRWWWESPDHKECGIHAKSDR